MADAIALEGVTKTFGKLVAVKDLDLRVRAGGIYGMIGPNGAGKTTTIRMIMSIVFPDRGAISVLGHDSALDAKDRIGYLPEERGLYRKMKVGAFLAYMSNLKGRADTGGRRRVREWLERVGLADVENKRCEELSKGMQQKIQFVSAVIHEPELVILDEPFSGLDPVNMRLLRDLVLELHRQGTTIIFSTHVMTQAEQLCDHVIMIHDGAKVLDDDIAGIRKRFDPRTVLVEPLDADADPEAMGRLRGVEAVERDGGIYHLSLGPASDAAGIMREAVSAFAVARIEIARPTLEDVFVEIVTRQAGVDAEVAHRIRASLREEPAAEGR